MGDPQYSESSANDVAQFSLITGLDTEQARFFVESAGGDLQVGNSFLTSACSAFLGQALI